MYEAVSSTLLLQALVSHDAPAGPGSAQGRQEPRRENTEGDTPSWCPEMCPPQGEGSEHFTPDKATLLVSEQDKRKPESLPCCLGKPEESGSWPGAA